MKFLIISIILLIGISTYTLQFLNIPQISDLTVSKEKDIFAGAGEVCATPYIEITCEKGLVCVYNTDESLKNGICLEKGKIYEDNILVTKDAKKYDEYQK